VCGVDSPPAAFRICRERLGALRELRSRGVVIVFYHQGVSILVNAMAAKEVRASAQTLLLLVGQGMGPLFANLFTGRLAAHTGGNLQSVFLFAACLSGLATLVLVLRGRRLNDAGRALPR